MKCKSCGANYKLLDNACPYCGRENAIGRFWNGEIKFSKDQNESARVDAAKRLPVVTFTKVIHRVLILEIIILIVWFIIAPHLTVETKDMKRDAYEMFLNECMKVEDMVLGYDEMDGTDLYYSINKALGYASDILKQRGDYENYNGLMIYVPEGQEYVDDVTRALRYQFHLSDIEIRTLRDTKYTSDLQISLYNSIILRTGWAAYGQ